MHLTPPPVVTLQAISDGPKGVNQTLRVMRQFTRAGKRHYPLRVLALSLVKHNGHKDWFGEVRDIHAYVRDTIRYVRDIVDIETLATPQNTLEIGQGDCDDKSVLLASMLESIGHPTRFVAVGFTPGNYSHVLVETKIGNKWIALETTEPVNMGWFPPGVVSRMVMHNR
jgi:transglutaminase-like putative cysteine protease